METFNAQLAETDRLIALTLENAQVRSAEVMKTVEGKVDPEAKRVVIETNLAAARKEVEQYAKAQKEAAVRRTQSASAPALEKGGVMDKQLGPAGRMPTRGATMRYDDEDDDRPALRPKLTGLLYEATAAGVLTAVPFIGAAVYTLATHGGWAAFGIWGLVLILSPFLLVCWVTIAVRFYLRTW